MWSRDVAGVAGPAYCWGQDWSRPVPVAAADGLCGGTGMVAEQPALSFAGLLRRLRAGAKLTQEELAAAAGVSPRSVSNLERGINRTAHKDTAVLLAGALGLTGPAADLFVAAARGHVPAAQVLFAHAYAALCAYVGPPAPQEWNHYAIGEPQPKACG